MTDWLCLSLCLNQHVFCNDQSAGWQVHGAGGQPERHGSAGASTAAHAARRLSPAAVGQGGATFQPTTDTCMAPLSKPIAAVHRSCWLLRASGPCKHRPIGVHATPTHLQCLLCMLRVRSAARAPSASRRQRLALARAGNRLGELDTGQEPMAACRHPVANPCCRCSPLLAAAAAAAAATTRPQMHTAHQYLSRSHASWHAGRSSQHTAAGGGGSGLPSRTAHAARAAAALGGGAAWAQAVPVLAPSPVPQCGGGAGRGHAGGCQQQSDHWRAPAEHCVGQAPPRAARPRAAAAQADGGRLFGGRQRPGQPHQPRQPCPRRREAAGPEPGCLLQKRQQRQPQLGERAGGAVARAAADEMVHPAWWVQCCVAGMRHATYSRPE